MNNPTIKEKLEYLKICDVAIEEAKKIAEKSKNKAFGEDASNDFKTVKQWENVRSRIATDLIKDPGFINYVSNLTPLQKEEENILHSHPLR